MSRLLFVFFIIFLRASITDAQDFPMRHFDIDDGLPSNTVYEIYRDSKGLLWIATDKGIARFNGVKFEKFTMSDGLADNEVFFFQEDYFGRVWIATYNGELCYFQDGIFHNPINTPFLKLPFKTSNFIHYIVPQQDSTVIIGFFGEPKIINVYKNKVIIRNIKNEHNDSILKNTQLYEVMGQHLPAYRTVNARKISDSLLEINYPYKSFYLNRENKIFSIRSNPNNKLRYCSFTQNVRLYVDDSVIYNTDGSHLFKKPSFLNPHTTSEINSNDIFRVYINGDSKLYIANNGMYDDSTLLLRKNNVSSITQDKTGNYWLSTLNDGIFNFSKYFYSDKFVANGYKGEIRYSCIRNGRLIYVTDDNNVYWLQQDKPICLYHHNLNKSGKYKHPNLPGYLIDSNYKFYSFYGDKHIVIDNLFDSRPQKRIYKVSREDGIRMVFLHRGDIYFNDGYDVVKVHYASLGPGDRIGTLTGLCSDPSRQERIFCSAQSHDGSIWYSTRNKMYKVDNDKSIPQIQFKDVSFKIFDFCGKYIIGCSHTNKLLIGNNMEQNPVFDSVKDQNCVWDKLYKLDSAHVLIGTNSNYRLLTLSKSDTKPRFELFTVENTMIPLQAESICSDGKNCYFFKKGSITSVEVKTLFTKSQPPEVSISYLKMGQRKLSVKDKYSIPFGSSKDISLGIAAISFSGRDISYQYSISKTDAGNWSSMNGEEINLFNPSYGNYIIKVRAKTLSSDYCEPIVFKLNIIKPFWATWWFILMAVVALGGIIAGLVRWRLLLVISKREREHDSKVKFMKSEYKALNALMNPHFIFNTLNNVQSLFNGNNKLAANEYLRVFADLIRQNMHNVSKELIPLQKEIDLITNYLSLEKLRFEDKLNYKINLDDDLELYDIMIPPLLIQPLVENSIKHGILPLKTRSGFIQVNIREQNDVLVIEIKDNGVGLNNSEAKEGSLHESFGLDNIRKRIEQLAIIQNKEITFQIKEESDDQDRGWTIVTITMPL